MHKKIIEIPIKNFLSTAIYKKKFLRMDIIINYLAIENYFNKNDYGWKLYEKYQQYSPLVQGIDIEYRKKLFIKLIDAFANKDFIAKNHPLKLSRRFLLHVRDGAHRLACAIYFKYPSLYGFFFEGRRMLTIGSMRRFFYRRCSTLYTLRKRKFTQNEILLILECKNRILKEYGLKCKW